MKMQEKMIIGELAKRVVKKKVATPLDQIRQDLINAYHLGDAFEIMKNIPSKTMDLIDLDPPYGIEFTKTRTA